MLPLFLKPLKIQYDVPLTSFLGNISPLGPVIMEQTTGKRGRAAIPQSRCDGMASFKFELPKIKKPSRSAS